MLAMQSIIRVINDSNRRWEQEVSDVVRQSFPPHEPSDTGGLARVAWTECGVPVSCECSCASYPPHRHVSKFFCVQHVIQLLPSLLRAIVDKSPMARLLQQNSKAQCCEAHDAQCAKCLTNAQSPDAHVANSAVLILCCLA